MTVRILKSKVTLEGIGSVEVSTVDLYSHGVRFVSGYETCLFWGRDSAVVETYSNWEEAQEGHAKWSAAEKIAQAMVAHAVHCMYDHRIDR